MSDKIFANGIYITPKSENTPKFITTKLAFDVEKFVECLKQNVNDKGWVYVDVCVSTAGKKYFAINTFKPIKKDETTVVPTDDAFAKI